MKKIAGAVGLAFVSILFLFGMGVITAAEEDSRAHAELLYMGHASIRITTAEGKVIYIDPFAGDGYEPAADLILITHGHYDHNAPEKVVNRTPDCRVITWEEALEGGTHQSFDLGYVTARSRWKTGKTISPAADGSMNRKSGMRRGTAAASARRQFPAKHSDARRQYER